MNYAPKTPAEIETLAWDFVAGKLFSNLHCEKEETPQIFMLLSFLDEGQIEAMRTAKIAFVYEYLSEAGPVSVNGRPSFLSARYLNEDDFDKLRTRVIALEEQKQQAISTALAKAS